MLSLSACDRFQRPRTAFNGEASLAYVRAQLGFGPRVPGSRAHERAGDWIVAQMKQRTDSVVVQSWAHVTATGDTLRLRNVLARINPTATQRVLYLTHWDTRPTADEDMNLGNKRLPIQGANDGASGVALLMGIADALKTTPPLYGVDLLFVDGEDYGSFDGYNADSALTKHYDVLIGSTYFAQHLPSADYRPIFGLLFDMIGDKDLQIYQESNSVAAAPEIISLVEEIQVQLRDVGIELEPEEAEVVATVLPRTRDRKAKWYLRAGVPSKKAVEAQIAGFNAGKATPHMFETDELYAMWEQLLQTADPKASDALLRKIGNYKFENFETIPLFGVPIEVVVDPKIIEDWPFSGWDGGDMGHTFLISACKQEQPCK